MLLKILSGDQEALKRYKKMDKQYLITLEK
jgi:hypothetical protein